MAYEKGMGYLDGQPSSIGENLILFQLKREAIIDAAKESYFSQMTSTENIPKHYGKKIKKNVYIPLLDPRNVSDQGIDATGASIKNKVTITMLNPDKYAYYAIGKGNDATTATAKAEAVALDVLRNEAPESVQPTDTFATLKTRLEGLGWEIITSAAVNAFGNLTGGSKDIGVITESLPLLTEYGGRVNRVGFTRVNIEASIKYFGYFFEYTRESLDFDNDKSLHARNIKEAIKGANELNEKIINIDLLHGANNVLYGGNATSNVEITGEVGANPSELTYSLLKKMARMLKNSRTPKNCKIIKGSRLIDTKTVGATRYAYIGPELADTLEKIEDYRGEKAFVKVEQYAGATTVARGEIGAIGDFRFIEVPEMVHWAGKGAEVTDNAGYRSSNGHYDIFPVLIVTPEAFTALSFHLGQNGGSKFKMMNKPLGQPTSEDPYGQTGLWSIQWYYGMLIERPEWLGVIKVVAPI